MICCLSRQLLYYSPPFPICQPPFFIFFSAGSFPLVFDKFLFFEKKQLYFREYFVKMEYV